MNSKVLLPNTINNIIDSEHLKCSPPRFAHIIGMCFSKFFVHSYLPSQMIETTLVPLITKKAGDLYDQNNYYPVSLFSVLSRILEVIILEK